MTREEFNNYVRHMSRTLYGFAFRILRNQEEAEDAVQEVFIRMWNMGKKIDGYSSIDALATKMIKNYSIDQLRKQKHLSRDKDAIQNNLTFPSHVEIMERIESYNIIQTIISRMPDLYRDIINLRDIEELSYEEIADRTGQNINALRVTLSRARALLRDEYKKYFNEKR
jgi:RNA polymerase sigma-70 factor (ECF subfamily)